MSLYEFRFRLVYNISWLCMFVPLAKDCPKPLVPDWHASPQWYLQPRFVSIPNRSWCCLSWLRCTETCEMSQYQPSHVLRHSWVAATSKVRAVQLVEAALISKQSRIRWNDMECLQLEPEHGNVEKGIAGHMAVEGRCIVMMHFKGLNTFECFGCHCCSQVLSWVRNQHCKCSEGSSFGEKMLERIWLTWCLQSLQSLQSSSILFNPLQSSSILFNPLQSSSSHFICFLWQAWIQTKCCCRNAPNCSHWRSNKQTSFAPEEAASVLLERGCQADAQAPDSEIFRFFVFCYARKEFPWNLAGHLRPHSLALSSLQPGGLQIDVFK